MFVLMYRTNSVLLQNMEWILTFVRMLLIILWHPQLIIKLLQQNYKGKKSTVPIYNHSTNCTNSCTVKYRAVDIASDAFEVKKAKER